MRRNFCKWSTVATALSVLFLTAPVVIADEQDAVTRTLGDDLFVSGSQVRADRGAIGDAIAAGGEVTLTGSVGGDAVVAGGKLNVRSPVAQDLYAAGGEINVDSEIGSSARLAGGSIRIGRSALIRGGLTAAGGEVHVDGEVARYLQVFAGETHINGRVRGDVEVSGGKLVIGPQAVIEGGVRFKGPQPAEVAPGAQVRGDVQHVQAGGKGVLKVLGGAILVWLFGWIIVGAIVVALWPGLSRKTTTVIRAQPGWSSIAGFGLLMGGPVLAVMLMMTLIGIPLGLMFLVLYFLLLPLGYLLAATAISDSLLMRRHPGQELATRQRVFMLLLVLVGLFVVSAIPVVGSLLSIMLTIVGMGSLVLATFAKRERGSPPPTV